VMVGAMTVNVLSRIFANDIAWSTEVVVFLMTWTVFLGGAAATRRGIHMRVTEFVDQTGKWRSAVERGLNVLVLLFLAYLAYYGFRLSLIMMDQLSSVLYYPMGLQYAALPVGAVVSMFFLLEDVLRNRWYATDVEAEPI